MEAYIYHSPDGDRELVALNKNSDGTVDLGTVNPGAVDPAKKQTLEIGKCPVGPKLGGCEPKGKDEEDTKSSKK